VFVSSRAGIGVLVRGMDMGGNLLEDRVGDDLEVGRKRSPLRLGALASDESPVLA